MMNNNLQLLRKYMQKNKIEAYIFFMGDAHLSEYVPTHWKVIDWFSGFTGSAGTIIVTQDFAGLWTDSRYFIQAAEQLKNTGIELVKLKIPHTPEYINWIKEQVSKNKTIAFDMRTISASAYQLLKNKLENKNFNFIHDEDFVSLNWENRPELPKNPIFVHDEKFAGKSRSEKITTIRKYMSENQADNCLISSLDDIAWILNLRGSDTVYSPLFVSHLIIQENNCTLFIDLDKIPEKIKSVLNNENIIVKEYNEINNDLKSVSETVIMDFGKINCLLFNALPDNIKKINELNYSTHLKSVKNTTEINHVRETMIKDGVALEKFFYWLENNIGKEKITELSAAEKLRFYRREQEHFFSDSFATIPGYKHHGAMPHYEADEKSDIELKPESLFLIDSGGQYYTGTTDTTRVIALGKPSDEEKRCFTLGLKGMLALSMLKFPYGTKGYQIEAFARKALWDYGLNYGHGTGHGVGFFLNVHEGPQTIGSAASGNLSVPLKPGMLLSNEPGFYKEGEFGIRTENLMFVAYDKTTDYGDFLKFDTVTLCHIDQKLIEKSLLNQQEVDWINNYHKMVYEKISPFLELELQNWLKEKTKAL